MVTHTQTYRNADIQTYRHTDVQTYRHPDIQTYRRTGRQTYTHTEVETYRHTDIHACIHTYIHMGVRVCLCMRLPNDYTNTSLPCLCRFLPKIPHLTPGFPSFAISSSRSSSRRRWSASVNGGSATPSSNGQRGAAGKMPRCGRWGSGRVDGVGMAQNQGILDQK